MTDGERRLLESLIKWCRDAADKAAKTRPDESLGLLRAAAKFEDEFKRVDRGE